MNSLVAPQKRRNVAQQYALPLQCTNSHPLQGSLKESSGNNEKQGEHTLRRKTPNGVLAAAYDSTLVDQIDRPHADKHIILPVTNATKALKNGVENGQGIQQTIPMRSSHYSSEVALQSGGRQQQISNWGPDTYQGYSAPGFGWSNTQLPQIQIDSMLNQLPYQPQLQYQQNGQQYFPVLQPSLQTPLGPTISNDQGPYGPYWPNGTYIPYKPAAIRDPRYNHDLTDYSWQNYSDTSFLQQSANLRSHRSSFDPTLSQIPGPSPSYLVSHQQALDIAPHQFSPNYTLQQATQQLNNSGHSTPSGHTTPLASSLTEFGAQSENAQLRERVSNWAHAIYIDLLTYIHKTRKHASRNGTSHTHPPRPNIFPKPPRQPGSNFSNLSLSRRASDSATYNQSKITPINSNLSSTSNYSHRPFYPSGLSSAQSSASPNTSTNPFYRQPTQLDERIRTLRRSSGTSISPLMNSMNQEISPTNQALAAIDAITTICVDCNWKWIDGVLVGGCLAYALGDYQKALNWYSKILNDDPNHVEAISNLAATLLALNRRQEAEEHWLRAVKLRPSYFEAVEHLIGLLCSSQRGKEAVAVIEFVERSLLYINPNDSLRNLDGHSENSDSTGRSPSSSETSDKAFFDFDGENDGIPKDIRNYPGADQPGFSSSGYAIPGSENGRMLALVHAKGNMLYALGNNAAAAKAFENGVLIAVGRRVQGIGGLIKRILQAFSIDDIELPGTATSRSPHDPILLPPSSALQTARLCFKNNGELPGLRDVPDDGMARKAAISTTSNSLLSLAKIFQDGMSTNSPKANSYQTSYGVREILALYYLSLSLQPSPSTANNVGILLASVQQTMSPKQIAIAGDNHQTMIPGVVPGSGIALALAYYNYGLNLDSRHAHLFTNLGSLLKDIGQLSAAIKMYEQAVACDGNFDIALANLANAVKDQGRIADAIGYYKRAVHASPDFAEAVCGLANALNSVCGWQGRGGIVADGGKRDRWHVGEDGLLLDATLRGASSGGWIKRVVDLVERQLADGEDWGRGMIDKSYVDYIFKQLSLFNSSSQDAIHMRENGARTMTKWMGQKWEGHRLVRLVERAIRRLGWHWYQDKYVNPKLRSISMYSRPHLPTALTVPTAPTVLPFHTFTSPMSAKQIRLISQRNGLRISCSALKALWLPPTVYPPPPPPNPYLKVGYVSSDFNNHPLAHLMQSVFGLHNSSRVSAYCYATTASDNSVHRQQIETEAPVFYDASAWSVEKLVGQIVKDGIHILVNLNGYTRGARNEVFAARPSPIQMSFMGFAGTLGAEWCDYLLADDTAVPPDTLRPWRRNIDLEDQLVDENSGGNNEDWVYGENIIFCRDTFFCCDHRQSAPDSQEPKITWEEEQVRRWNMRKEIFPNLPDDVIILANFNQLYKIEPTTFRTWLRILDRIPKAVLWLLRFPDLGETNLKQIARAWASDEVASRILFTDVAPKHQHISRARICDLFLDTPECNAHTTAADVLWSGTPLLTLPRYKYKMCSRMAASILKGALPKGEDGDRAREELVAGSEEEYEERAVRLGRNCVYRNGRATGRLSELRRLIFEGRWTSPLFDTRRWVRDLEDSYEIAWSRWVRGEGGDIWLEQERPSKKK
ncbi:glycosyltransferase family 41 protein [Patellaria atrata CBS 101060]|uniref:protein O-GlcNAc transferase n=1 Tax=Patellaria atrata CBS 101060 TaxID=1346257 RepID=A0A9P4SHX2_9PEZI|nr:glycosyltransferase family 41 protein [Patellaria atrata CBS 101060]